MILRVRLAVVAVVALAGVVAGAQAPQRAPGTPPVVGQLFNEVRPDLTLIVKRHSLGADLVEVTPTDADYPSDLLREQILSLGRAIGSEPRGLRITVRQIDPANEAMKFLSASFAVDGLMDPGAGTVRLQQIAQSFGTSERVNGMTVILDRFRPTSNTVLRFESPGLRVGAAFQQGVGGLEYRLHFRSHESKDLIVGDSAASSDQTEAKAPQSSGPPNGLFIVLGLIGVAVGALVYSLALRSMSKR